MQQCFYKNKSKKCRKWTKNRFFALLTPLHHFKKSEKIDDDRFLTFRTYTFFSRNPYFLLIFDEFLKFQNAYKNLYFARKILKNLQTCRAKKNLHLKNKKNFFWPRGLKLSSKYWKSCLYFFLRLCLALGPKNSYVSCLFGAEHNSIFWGLKSSEAISTILSGYALC